jgi:enoyl-CoA hydratase/carnithine racemase
MSDVTYEKKEHVAHIRLNRPESRNAINRSLTRELITAWCDFRDDPDLWVAILSGEGKSFCGGADLKEMERGQWQFRQSLLYGDERIGPSNYGVWKPIVAAVHGHVYGAGLLLALESDIIVADEDALFGIPETRVNVPFLTAPFIYHYLPRNVANEMMYTSKPIGAKRAYDVGVVNRIVPSGQILATAKQIADDICLCGPLANRASKELAFRCKHMDFQSAIALIEHIAPPVWNSEDSVEAKKAFLEKRPPNWKLK